MVGRGHGVPEGAAAGLGFPLPEVVARPVRSTAERVEWDSPMDDRHESGFRGMFGDGLRHVAAGPGGRRLALSQPM